MSLKERLNGKLNYVIPLFLFPVVATFGHAIAPNESVLFGRDWGVIGAFIFALLTFALWLPQKKVAGSWHRTQLCFFWILITAWLFQSISAHLDSRGFNTSAILFPFAIWILMAKKPSSKMLHQAFIWFLYSLVTISLLAFVLGMTDVMPNGFNFPDSAANRLPVLNDLFGVTTRWAGPFGSVNLAAPIGALLFVAGFTLKGINRVVIVSGGLGVLTLSQGRTSLAAALLALTVLLAYSKTVQNHRYAKQVRLGAGLITVSSLMLYIVLIDPTLNGRTPVWNNFLRLFTQDPLFGIGTSGLEGYLAAGVTRSEVVLYSHGHNVLIDISVRYGIFLVILTIAAFTIAAIISWRARAQDSGKTLALIVFFFTAGLAETIFSWQYFSAYTVVFIYVVTVSDQISAKKKILTR